MIDNIISTSAQYGMMSIEKSIANLILSGDITVEDGLKYALKPQEVKRLISRR